jgi:hypothetical protein
MHILPGLLFFRVTCMTRGLFMKHRRLITLFILCCLAPSYSVDRADAAKALSPDVVEQGTACSNFNELNSLIRDSLISSSVSRKILVERLAEIRAEYYLRDGRDYRPTDWVFPVAGYSAAAINQGKGHGFISRGYNYFSGNRHGGHPAYDIFIRDRNQDCRDDLNGKPVPVLSMTGGIVVAREKEWQTGSGLRGGKYLWVYDPANELLVYYAHNETLTVEPGTIVRPGDQLATVGRSGLNAAKRRSPTHLHFSVLRIVRGEPIPMPVYRELLYAGKNQLQNKAP